jgi:dihydroorotate dehydrogenase (NAD+) catalytic subunit
MPASGTYGYGLEYQAYGDPALLGALVVKSLSATTWDGNPPPRLRPLTAGSMLNSIGLPNPGVEAWASGTLPRLLGRGVTVVASIWGHTPEELLDAAQLMAKVAGPVAWEVNMSCPNLATSDEMPSHNPEVAYEVCAKIRTLADDAVGVWAKLSPQATDVPAVAAACHDAGADAVTLTNTYPAKALQDTDVAPANVALSARREALPPRGGGADDAIPTRAAPPREPEPHLGGADDTMLTLAALRNERLPLLGRGAGGVSGAALKPMVTAIVAAVRERCPDLAVVAAGGVLTVDDALDYLDLGAAAVQVGTANFLDPRATHRIAHGVVQARREAATGG